MFPQHGICALVDGLVEDDKGEGGVRGTVIAEELRGIPVLHFDVGMSGPSYSVALYSGLMGHKWVLSDVVRIRVEV